MTPRSLAARGWASRPVPVPTDTQRRCAFGGRDRPVRARRGQTAWRDDRGETIEALADALHVPPGYLALGRPRAQVEVAEASFRRLRSTMVAQQQQATAYVEQVWELSCYLEEQVEFPELDLPSWAFPESQEPIDPVTAARLLRSHWGLGAGPVVGLVAEIENHGVIVLLFSMKEEGSDEKSRIDAFSTTALSRPVIVMTPDKADDVLRHRFSAAHEIGHIVMHHGRHGSDSEMERQADRFAAEFLTPDAAIRPLLPHRVTFDRVEALSQHWGVSAHSLLHRMRERELVSESTARRAYVTLSSTPRRTQLEQPVPGHGLCARTRPRRVALQRACCGPPLPT